MNTKNIDASNMRQVIIDSPSQLAAGLELAKHISLKGDFSNVIICGIGGSALPAELVQTLQIATKVPLYIHKDYGLPRQATEESLIIAISYSGNTEETVFALTEALEKNMIAVAITTGGGLLALAKQHNRQSVIIPSGIQPRCATGYIFSALMQVLANANVIKDSGTSILETAKELEENLKALEQEGIMLAKTLKKALPIVYASKNFEALARIWKIKFNENSKIPAFYNFFPELNHNEMVGYTGLATLGLENAHVIILKDTSDHPRNIKRMKLTAGIIEKSGGKTTTIDFKEGSLLFKIFSSLMLGDFTSYYLALEYGIDPTPVATVEEFKGNMAK